MWDGQRFALLDRHMRRLEASARYFAMAFEEKAAMAALSEAVDSQAQPLRVRLLLGDDGIEVTTAPLVALTHLRFRIAPDRISSAEPLLYHKTTRRDFYDRARTASGADEVVFVNERGELTEGSFTNLFLRLGGALLTPALACGLLPGTLREELLATGAAAERVLTVDDLATAQAIFLGNSVRGLVTAEWLGGNGA